CARGGLRRWAMDYW
nr:immunoglobulin heavy chain junction region [Mus musculus]